VPVLSVLTASPPSEGLNDRPTNCCLHLQYGSRVQGSEFGVQNPGFRVKNSGSWVQGPGFRVWGLDFEV